MNAGISIRKADEAIRVDVYFVLRNSEVTEVKGKIYGEVTVVQSSRVTREIGFAQRSDRSACSYRAGSGCLHCV